MIKKGILFLLLLVFNFQPKLFAQDTTIHFIKEVPIPAISFSVDNIGELYIITPENQLKKFDEKGDSVGVFNLVAQYGKLSYVNAENPWKTILFYKNFSTIVLLDKYLNVVTSINLRKQNIYKVQAVCTSYDNNIWLFDEQENKLKKIDDNGNLLSETVDFRLLFDSVPDPQKIVDRDGFVYLNDPERGMYVFDYYGSFKNKLTFLNWKNIAVIGKNIYGFDEQNLYKYSPPLPDFTTIKLPVEMQNSSSIQLRNHKIYVLKNDRLSIYSLK